jgi:hypothetical protein
MICHYEAIVEASRPDLIASLGCYDNYFTRNRQGDGDRIVRQRVKVGFSYRLRQ